MSEHIERVKLDEYVEQALPVAERRRVEAHVTTCPACQARLAEAKQMTALLYSLPRENPAPNLALRINAAIAAQRAPASTQWVRFLVPAMFVIGMVLLTLSAPRWSGWAGVAAAAQWPNDQAVMAWLDNLVADPSIAVDMVMALAEQTLTGAADDMGALVTLATVFLATASLAGLAQLLGGKRSLTAVQL